jgi:hypothetical protein
MEYGKKAGADYKESACEIYALLIYVSKGFPKPFDTAKDSCI